MKDWIPLLSFDLEDYWPMTYMHVPDIVRDSVFVTITIFFNLRCFSQHNTSFLIFF